MMQRLKAIIKKQAGLTFIELLIALSLTGIITASSTMIVFQVFDGEARANNHLDAISRVQNAGREISRDASMAQVITLPEEGDADGLPLTMVWNEWDDNSEHQAEYFIEDNILKRTHYLDGEETETYNFEHIISIDPDTEEVVTFFDDDTFTFTLTASVGIGSQRISATREYRTAPRPSL